MLRTEQAWNNEFSSTNSLNKVKRDDCEHKVDSSRSRGQPYGVAFFAYSRHLDYCRTVVPTCM